MARIHVLLIHLGLFILLYPHGHVHAFGPVVGVLATYTKEVALAIRVVFCLVRVAPHRSWRDIRVVVGHPTLGSWALLRVHLLPVGSRLVLRRLEAAESDVYSVNYLSIIYFWLLYLVFIYRGLILDQP